MNCPTCDHPIGPCREYRGVRDKHGYGKVNWGPKRSNSNKGRVQVLLHRWVVEQVLGRKLGWHEVVRHICGNTPICASERRRGRMRPENGVP
jgi:hypothetical protein